MNNVGWVEVLVLYTVPLKTFLDVSDDLSSRESIDLSNLNNFVKLLALRTAEGHERAEFQRTVVDLNLHCTLLSDVSHRPFRYYSPSHCHVPHSLAHAVKRSYLLIVVHG